MVFEPMYPDVLGAITGGTRISMDELQFALGIFPQRTYVNQPVEAILILQNMVDQPMQVKVAFRLPSEDKKGNPVVIDTPKTQVALGLRPGEVGVLRMPVIPHPPTPPGTAFPVQVAVRYRTAKPGRAVRPPAGGAPPSVLSVSSFKLQVLRDVPFSAHTWNQSAEIVTSYFDIAPKVMPPVNQNLEPRYETLWTAEEMVEEREMVQAKVAEANRFSTRFTRSVIYEPLIIAVDESFAERGMPLHPGEAKAIAKMITYTIDEGLTLEPGFSIEDSRWFQVLCQVMAHDPNIEQWDRGDLTVEYLFEPAMYDAILLAFAILSHKTNEDLGDASERAHYANTVLNWYAGRGEPDVSYIYLPLALGGVIVNQIITSRGENPWTMLDELQQAANGRAKLLQGDAAVIFHILDELLKDASKTLSRMRIDRTSQQS